LNRSDPLPGARAAAPATPAIADRPGFREFIALMAALMASNALAIDAMLPALPAIGEALGRRRGEPAPARHHRLSDRLRRRAAPLGAAFGPVRAQGAARRRPVLYGVFGDGGAVQLHPAARRARLQGVAAAATRVLVVASCATATRGPAMARVMSLVMIVFMIVPVLAPFFGQAVLAVSTWRHIFIGLGVYGAVLALWTAAAAARDAGAGEQARAVLRQDRRGAAGRRCASASRSATRSPRPC
jgi:DHA1 family bicyclomycin/chloramphenicol resistance-like MFS transporter